MPTDAELVAQSLAGDRRAYGQIVHRYWSQVLATAHAVLASPDEAQDAAQDAFIAAHRNLRGLRQPDKLAAWLGVLARNTARQHLRRRKLEQARFGRGPEMVDDLVAVLPENATDFSYRTVRTAVGALAGPERSAIVLFYFVGLSIAQIAAQLDVPAGTIKSRLHRGRNQLGKRMEDMSNSQQEQAPRDVIGGMRGHINWSQFSIDKELSQWRLGGQTDKPVWTQEGHAIIGDDHGLGDDSPLLIAATKPWRNFELSLLITPFPGSCNAQVAFRLQVADKSFYLFDMLLGWQAIAISRVIEGRLTKISVVNFPIERGREYEIELAARGESLTSYVDGRLINQVRDDAIDQGQVALMVWESKTAYRDMRYRLLH
ncbi:MAG: sigma-70 family RNA polymerase sigma factor [Candidatus Latescibacteria bacterium]|nr:sigma-70 family RNA polymerase sigma factor [Candidatus Latescibacterota bacterium]